MGKGGEKLRMLFSKLNRNVQPGMGGSSTIPALQRRRQESQEFNASLSYITTSRLTWATQQVGGQHRLMEHCLKIIK